MSERILQAETMNYEDDASLRPQRLDDYVGQKELKENMRVFVKAAKARNEALDHVLLYGPPGLGIYAGNDYFYKPEYGSWEKGCCFKNNAGNACFDSFKFVIN